MNSAVQLTVNNRLSIANVMQYTNKDQLNWPNYDPGFQMWKNNMNAIDIRYYCRKLGLKSWQCALDMDDYFVVAAENEDPSLKYLGYRNALLATGVGDESVLDESSNLIDLVDDLCYQLPIKTYSSQKAIHIPPLSKEYICPLVGFNYNNELASKGTQHECYSAILSHFRVAEPDNVQEYIYERYINSTLTLMYCALTYGMTGSEPSQFSSVDETVSLNERFKVLLNEKVKTSGEWDGVDRLTPMDRYIQNLITDYIVNKSTFVNFEEVKAASYNAASYENYTGSSIYCFMANPYTEEMNIRHLAENIRNPTNRSCLNDFFVDTYMLGDGWMGSRVDWKYVVANVLPLPENEYLKYEDAYLPFVDMKRLSMDVPPPKLTSFIWPSHLEDISSIYHDSYIDSPKPNNKSSLKESAANVDKLAKLAGSSSSTVDRKDISLPNKMSLSHKTVGNIGEIRKRYNPNKRKKNKGVNKLTLWNASRYSFYEFGVDEQVEQDKISLPWRLGEDISGKGGLSSSSKSALSSSTTSLDTFDLITNGITSTTTRDTTTRITSAMTTTTAIGSSIDNPGNVPKHNAILKKDIHEVRPKLNVYLTEEVRNYSIVDKTTNVLGKQTTTNYTTIQPYATHTTVISAYMEPDSNYKSILADLPPNLSNTLINPKGPPGVVNVYNRVGAPVEASIHMDMADNGKSVENVNNIIVDSKMDNGEVLDNVEVYTHQRKRSSIIPSGRIWSPEEVVKDRNIALNTAVKDRMERVKSMEEVVKDRMERVKSMEEVVKDRNIARMERMKSMEEALKRHVERIDKKVEESKKAADKELAKTIAQEPQWNSKPISIDDLWMTETTPSIPDSISKAKVIAEGKGLMEEYDPTGSMNEWMSKFQEKISKEKEKAQENKGPMWTNEDDIYAPTWRPGKDPERSTASKVMRIVAVSAVSIMGLIAPTICLKMIFSYTSKLMNRTDSKIRMDTSSQVIHHLQSSISSPRTSRDCMASPCNPLRAAPLYEMNPSSFRSIVTPFRVALSPYKDSAYKGMTSMTANISALTPSLSAKESNFVEGYSSPMSARNVEGSQDTCELPMSESTPRFTELLPRLPELSPRFPIPVPTLKFPILTPRFPLFSARFPILSPRLPSCHDTEENGEKREERSIVRRGSIDDIELSQSPETE